IADCCARRERPSGCRGAEQRDELAPFQLMEVHSISASQVGWQDSEGAANSQRVSERPHNLAGAELAIRAVASRSLLGVRFAFDPDIAAVARDVDFHEFVPFRRSASAIAFIGTPVQVSDILRPSRRLDCGWAVAMLRATWRRSDKT